MKQQFTCSECGHVISQEEYMEFVEQEGHCESCNWKKIMDESGFSYNNK